MILTRRLFIISLSLILLLIFFLLNLVSFSDELFSFNESIEPDFNEDTEDRSIAELQDFFDWDEWDEEKAIEDYIGKIVNEVDDYVISPIHLEKISKLTEKEIGIMLRQSIKSKAEKQNEKKKENVDVFASLPFEFDIRVRQDQSPDGKPWAELETHRVVKQNTTKQFPRENATIFTLCRNEDMYEILGSIEQLETRFNSKYHYDWVFLNDEAFTDEFVEITSNLVSGTARYGLIPPEQWSFPSHLDYEKAKKLWKSQKWSKVIYGSSESYRHMCRFNSMFFYKHPIVQEYQYYWRVEPDVKFNCDIEQDPFRFMRENNKKYGFNLSMKELPVTIQTLWRETRSFFRKLDHDYFDASKNDNLVKFISGDKGVSYNNCHFWTNFEIANFDIFRNDLYESYVNYLDKSGGFFYERWGDAPIHSIIFSLMLNKDEIYIFQNISYTHTIATSCPVDFNAYKEGKCSCDRLDNWIFDENNCDLIYYEANKEQRPVTLDAYIDQLNSIVFDKYMDRELKKTERHKISKKKSEDRRKKIQEARQEKINKYLKELNTSV